jgi:hypothetical protein
MRTAIGAFLLALAAGSATAALDVDLQRYAEASRAGAEAEVSGRAYAEPRKPNAPDVPLKGAAVVAVPHSDQLIHRLEALRSGARASPTAYRQTASLMQKTRAAYEQDLWEAGAADLVHSAVVDAEGRFDLGHLPEGRWLVLATWDEFVEARGARTERRERNTYLAHPRLVGYRSRLVWLRALTVRRGEAAALDFNDRNVWFSGVIEERVLDAGPKR